MFISDEGLVSGSVVRADLVAAYAEATDTAVRENLAAVGAEHGMTVKGGKLVDPSEPEPAPEPTPEPEQPSRPTQADNKAAWVDWAVEQGLARDDAEQFTKAELIDEFGDKE